MKFRPLLLLPIFLIPSLAGAEAPNFEGIAPLVIGSPIGDIPVVHTAKELKKLEPLSTGEYDVRIGIEKDSCNLAQGALVYLLVDKCPAQHGYFETRQSQIPLGPLVVEFEPEIKSKKLKELQKTLAIAYRKNAGGAFFIAAIQPPAAGKYDVRVKTSDGFTLARTTLTVDEKIDQPWYKLEKKTHQQEDQVDIHLEFDSPYVFPHWPGYQAFELPKDDLPTMMPEKETPEFKVEAAGDAIKIMLKDETLEDDSLLARVWINDKPVAQSSQKDKLKQAIERLARASGDVEATLHFDFSSFDLKEGDKVAVQLALCRFGTRYMELDSMPMKQMQQDELRKLKSGEENILLSKKVTLTLTKKSLERPKEESPEDEAIPENHPEELSH